MSVRTQVLFFGAARDIVGTNEKTFTSAEDVTATAAFAQILETFPALSQKFGKSLPFAVNQNYASGEKIICNGDELAIFPPVSGGSGEVRNADFYEITAQPIDVGEIARRAVLSTCGATVTFDGYVRQWTNGRETSYLVYEAYESMAINEMQKLGVAAREQFQIAQVGIVHRLGRLEVGETSVCIAVAAPHRRAAFEACEWIIKELKRTVPIWKKEFYANGNFVDSTWVEGESEKLENVESYLP